MSYEWDESSFQTSSFQRRGRGGGGFRGNTNRFDRGTNDRRGGSSRTRYVRNDKSNYNNPNRSSDAKMIKVPTKFVGRIIGKGGSKINNLQFESGAKIIVTKEEENNETVIKLIGSDNAVEKAEELIKDLTVERENSYNNPPVGFIYEDSGNNSRPDLPLIDWQAGAAESDKYLKEKWSKLPTIKKQFYQEPTEVATMSPAEVAEFRRTNNNITVSRSFEDPEENRKPILNPRIFI